MAKEKKREWAEEIQIGVERHIGPRENRHIFLKAVLTRVMNDPVPRIPNFSLTVFVYKKQGSKENSIGSNNYIQEFFEAFFKDDKKAFREFNRIKKALKTIASILKNPLPFKGDFTHC